MCPSFSFLFFSHGSAFVHQFLSFLHALLFLFQLCWLLLLFSLPLFWPLLFRLFLMGKSSFSFAHPFLSSLFHLCLSCVFLPFFMFEVFSFVHGSYSVILCLCLFSVVILSQCRQCFWLCPVVAVFLCIMFPNVCFRFLLFCFENKTSPVEANHC